MPVYAFPTNIQPGDTGQTVWANSIGTALNVLGPLVDTKADDTAVVKLTGAQSIDGVKTFTSAPVVPDASFALAKVSGLVSALAGKASTTDLDNVFGIATAAVPQARTVAGKALTADVTLVKGDVGLGNVDNTTDANKPISTATQTALNLKAPLASPAFTGTPTGITKTHVGLSNVDNTSDANKPVSSATQTALNLKAPLASPTFTGTVSGVTKTHVGLGNVDNTADASKPVSSAMQTALDLKAPLANPTFTGTVSGVTKTHVGLGNVDNTSDANKPVSTAQASAIAAKVGSPNSSVTGLALYATTGDLPATGTVGVIYYVDAV